MPADAKPRWITVRKPFDYRWASGAVTTWRDADLGEHLVKAEVADFAVAGGYATEGKIDGSARSRKGTGAKRARRSAKKGSAAAKTAGSGTVPPVGDASAAHVDWPIDRPAVDDSTG